jgi:serine/threonine protein kinase/Tfp pilus assembly protein PilF
MDQGLSANTTLSHYRIVSKIGAGGMGEVYLAEDTRLDRNVALKILPADVASNQDRMNRFVREAKSAAALNHPNIAQIFEIGEHEGTHFIAMEFIDGVSLREKIHREQTELKKLLKFLQQVAEGLSKAHISGIVHRDLKPDNIMITREGFAKVLDFGLAKLVDRGPTLAQSDASNAPTNVMQQHSVPGIVMGTIGYMSPEQAQGKTAEIDQRSDIFSFGCILFEAVTRKKPFEGESVIKTLHSLIYEPAPQIRELNPSAPVELQRIVRRCLEKDADERYQTIKDVAIELKQLRREMPDSAGTDAEGSLSTDPPGNAKAASADSYPDAARSTQTSSVEYIVTGLKRHKLAAILSVIVIAAIIGGFTAYRQATSPHAVIQSIAVMPFINASGNAEVEYLSEGITETLIKSLSQLPNLNVKSRSSVFRYKGKETDAKTIGKELNVQAILNGRVVQRGEQLTLSLELIDAQTENVIWTDQYDRKSSDLVSLQNVIARDVSSKLKIQLSGADLEKLAKNYTNDPEAYRLYLQGRFYWNKRDGKEFERAEAYFQQAVARDPKFALGYIGLADFREDQDRPRKKEYIRRALELDDQLAEAHASLGYQYMVDYNWAESERELKRAIELNPNYPQAHQWNGGRLMMNGKYDAARVSLARALELDPTSPGINLYYGVLLEVSGRINESIQQYKKLIEMEPTFSWPHMGLARVYRRDGNHEGCVEERARNFELLGNKERAKAIRESFAKGGWKGYLREDGLYGPSSLAELGEYEKAIEAVVKQAEKGWFWLFLHRTDPFLDPIRDDPRFKEVMKKLDPPQ